HHLGGARQQLADVAAGEGGANGPEFAADLDRGGRLQVEGLDLARRAVQVQQDARPGPAEAGRRSAVAGLRLAEAGEPRQAEAEQPESADLEQVASGGSLAGALRRAEDAQHRGGLRRQGSDAFILLHAPRTSKRLPAKEANLRREPRYRGRLVCPVPEATG